MASNIAKLDQLARFPRVELAHLPTPLDSLPRLSAHLGGPRIFVKRDDQTGLALGGNKVRKLEYLVADALAKGADTLVTTGGVQSNHARQTAAAAAKLGLTCELVLPKVVDRTTLPYETSGNVLLDRLLGAELACPAPNQYDATLSDRLDRLGDAGRKPYWIPVGGSTPVGALGYVRAALELVEQLAARELNLKTIFVPTGSAGTHAGILGGMILAGFSGRVQGVAVSATKPEKEELVRALTESVLALFDEPATDLASRVHVDDAYVGPGYGVPTDAMIEAVKLTASLEGLFLDPVYTGKAMAGLIAAILRGDFSPNDSVLFWHTGGTAALFAYPEIF